MHQTFVIILRAGPQNNVRLKLVRSAKTFAGPCCTRSKLLHAQIRFLKVQCFCMQGCVQPKLSKTSQILKRRFKNWVCNNILFNKFKFWKKAKTKGFGTIDNLILLDNALNNRESTEQRSSRTMLQTLSEHSSNWRIVNLNRSSPIVSNPLSYTELVIQFDNTLTRVLKTYVPISAKRSTMYIH